MSSRKPGDPFSAAWSRVRAAGELIDVHPEVLEVLHYPRETVSASLPVRHDDGRLTSYKAWRCRHSDVLGPTKGGIRFHRGSSLREVMTLSLWMTFKCALLGLPFGGAKGAVCVDTHKLSQAELERLSRAWVRAFAHTIGPDRDIPAPDMYTNERVMAWMADEYAVLRGCPEPAVITGKPVALGGSEGRGGATGRGAFLALEALRERLGIDGQRRAVVVGFGNAGERIARLLHEADFRIVGLADSGGAIHDDEGFDPAAVARAKQEHGSVTDFEGGKLIDADELLRLDVDLLVPAALSDLIHRDNAGEVGAKVILEIANGPVAAEADAILAERGIAVVPDILANAGGVVVSWFEWLQNRSRDPWDADTVDRRLARMMRDAAGRTAEAAERYDVGLREAAYAVALERLSDAIMARSLDIH